MMTSAGESVMPIASFAGSIEAKNNIYCENNLKNLINPIRTLSFANLLVGIGCHVVYHD
jgi:hypothetical protein